MAPLLKIKSHITRHVLDKLCQLAEFNSGKVSLSTGNRKEICDQLEINSQQFSKALKQLKELNLIDGESGMFTINPYIFWKGDQSIRRQELLNNKAFQITYEIVDLDE
jgi:DNA repair photolyase